MKGTIVIRGESAGVKEATKELFKEVETDGERFSDRRASRDGNRKVMG